MSVQNAYAQAVPELLHYQFDGTGTNVPNLASAPPTGTATATIQGGITQGGTGQCGSSALVGTGVSATTDYLNTGWAPNLNTGSWTIAFWSSGFGSTTSLYYIFGDINTNSFRCFTNGVAGANNWILRGAGLTDIFINGGALSTPTYNAFVYDAVANNVKAYLNGVLVSTVAQTAPNLTGTGPLKVMGYSANIGAPVGGLLDDFRLYNRALDATEIALIASPSSTTSISIAITTGTNPSCFGSFVTFTATITNGGSSPTYQWTKNGTNIPSATLATYTGVAGTDFITGDLIRCVLTSNSTCVLPANATVTSTAITMNVTTTTISPSSLVDGTVGTAYSQTVTQTGLAGTPAWSISAGTLPAGLTLAGVTGVISGTPTTAETANFTVSVTNGTCTGTQTYSIIITSCPTVTVTPTPTTQSYVVGTAISSITLGASGVSGATYAYAVTSGALPAGVTLSAGVISGTPTTATAATSFTITATASIGSCTGTAVYNYSVVCPTLVFGVTTATGAIVGSVYSLNAGVTGNTQAVVYSVSSLFAGLSISSTTGAISGTPSAPVASATYTVTATQGTCTATQGYTFAVVCPTLVFGVTTATGATVGTAYSLNAGVTGNTQSVVYTVSSLPAGLSISSTTGAISGTPTAPAASATYTVTATQGTCSVTQGYIFAVACAGITINPATLANGIVGATYSQIATQTGLTGTPTWSVSVGTLPAGLSIAGATGVISGTPTTTGTSNFTISVTNGAGCTQTKIYFIVVACPTFVFGVTTATGGIIATAYSLNAGVTGNTSTIVYSVLPALPAGLSINAATGVISGTPTAITASATYVVTATQTVACFATQSYAFGVIPNCTPVVLGTAALADAIIGAPYTHTFMATGGSVGATYTFSTSVALPAGLSLDAATGVISGTPTLPTTLTFLVTARTPAPNNCATTIGYNLTVKLNAITSVDNSLANLVKVSPNPSSSDFNVDFGTINMAKSSVRVYDAQGKVVFTSENNNSTNGNLITISLDKFANGIYLLEVKTLNGRITKRLAKQ